MKKMNKNALSADAGTQESAEPQKSEDDIYEERYYEVEEELQDLTDAYERALDELLKEPQTEERSVKIIDHVIRYVYDHEKIIVCEQVPEDALRVVQGLSYELLRLLGVFLTDDHRREIVTYHAHGLSTSEAVVQLVNSDTVLQELYGANLMGWDELRAKLIHRLAYLKPGQSGWPEKKYGHTYREAREAYKREIQDIPLSSKPEQVALLVKHVQRIEKQLEAGGYDNKEMAVLTTQLIKTMDSLRRLTDDPIQRDRRLRGENILVLPSPEQLAIPSVKTELVWQLEQMIQGLKDNDTQKALVDEKTGVVEPS